MAKYPNVWDILKCVRDFRNIYTVKSAALLLLFVVVYSFSSIKPIKSFASGLCSDYDAVKNSVVSDLSNGFVEGCNNKVKLIKRSMYGRAKLNLLRAKILLAR
jgi:transposase